MPHVQPKPKTIIQLMSIGKYIIRLKLRIMLLQATIIRNYFVKTQTYVASFGPPGLSMIF